jgi:hypothetical protein
MLFREALVLLHFPPFTLTLHCHLFTLEKPDLEERLFFCFLWKYKRMIEDRNLLLYNKKDIENYSRLKSKIVLEHHNKALFETFVRKIILYSQVSVKNSRKKLNFTIYILTTYFGRNSFLKILPKFRLDFVWQVK